MRVALGDVYTGAFGNNQQLMEKIVAAGAEAGELVWQMPMPDDYKEQLKSDVADMKNVGSRWGGSITAAQFLAEFVGEIPWVHLDIAGTAWTDKNRPYTPKGATGIGVRLLTQFLRDYAGKS